MTNEKLRCELAEQIDELLDGLEYNAVDFDPAEVAIANKNFGPRGVYAEGWGQAIFHLRPKLRALILAGLIEEAARSVT